MSWGLILLIIFFVVIGFVIITILISEYEDENAVYAPFADGTKIRIRSIDTNNYLTPLNRAEIIDGCGDGFSNNSFTEWIVSADANAHLNPVDTVWTLHLSNAKDSIGKYLISNDTLSIGPVNYFAMTSYVRGNNAPDTFDFIGLGSVDKTEGVWPGRSLWQITPKPNNTYTFSNSDSGSISLVRNLNEFSLTGCPLSLIHI